MDGRLSSRVMNRVARSTAAILATAAILLAAVPASADLVYLGLRQGVWRVHFQRSLDATPREIDIGRLADASAPALSPDRGRVALEVAGVIVVCTIASPGECRSVRPAHGTAARPTWNPATGELAFVRYVADGKGEDADIFATRDGLSDPFPLLVQTGIQDDPDFSPDGRLLVYTVAQTVSVHRAGVQVVQQLWVADLGTGLARQLLPGTARDIHPVWAPSGRELAFASDRSGQFEIWTVKADGGGLRRLTSGSGGKTWPTWSPDGRSIMFTLVREGQQSLWLVDADGANPRPFEPFGRGSGVQLRDAHWRR